MFIILNRNGLAISISEWRSRLEWVYQTRWFRVTISIDCQCSVNFVSHSDLNFIERGFFPSLSIMKTLYWSSVIHSSSESVAGSQKTVTNGTDWTQQEFLYKSFIGIINYFFSVKRQKLDDDLSRKIIELSEINVSDAMDFLKSTAPTEYLNRCQRYH